MKITFKEVCETGLIVLMWIILIPVTFAFLVSDARKAFCEFLEKRKERYLSNKKYNEAKVRRKLYKRIYEMLRIQKEVAICNNLWISHGEYASYVTLNYIFTNNTNSFVYRKNVDKYLYNFYDFNGYKDDFVFKWINEIKRMFETVSDVQIEEIQVKNPCNPDECKDVLLLKIM